SDRKTHLATMPTPTTHTTAHTTSTHHTTTSHISISDSTPLVTQAPSRKTQVPAATPTPSRKAQVPTATPTPPRQVTPTPKTCPSMLAYGSQGSWVKTLQQRLNTLGFRDPAGHVLAVDGIFGSNTEYAVKRFQAKHALTV